MKIVIFIKGPIRPNAQFCIQNFHRITQMFSGHETKFVLHTWNNELDKEFINNVHNMFDCIVLCNEPDQKNVEENLLITRTPHGCGPFNAFKHFLTMKNASKLIYNTYSNYDYVFYFRIDTYYNILDLNQFFEKDAYVNGFDGIILLDITGCASPENFMKAWDYKDLPTLNALYGMSRIPEECVEMIMKMNSVKYVPKNFRNVLVDRTIHNVVLEFAFHPERHIIK